MKFKSYYEKQSEEYQRTLIKERVTKRGGFDDRDEVIEYLERWYHTLRFDSNGSAKLGGDLALFGLGIKNLPLKFSEVLGEMKLQKNKLSDFSWCDNLVVERGLDLTHNSFESLSGILGKVKKVRKLNLGWNPFKRDLLPLLILPHDLDLDDGWLFDRGSEQWSSETMHAMRIIMKPRHERVSLSRRNAMLIDIQHELIDAGLDRYANL